MGIRIVCYGDSNTYGYDGADPLGGRFPPEQRWPELLGGLLGCETVNCGMNGRRVPRFRRSIENDLALIRRAAPCDAIVVMLGSNDVMCEAEPEDTASHMRGFLTALTAAVPESAILLCAPPAVREYGDGFAAAFEMLAALYEALAEELGVAFADTERWQIPTGGDGLHFSARGHRIFAVKMAQTLRAIL